MQVSTDGRSYCVLGFVVSTMATSMVPRKYAHLDREAGKAGLRQPDLGSTATFSPVRTPRFEEAATALGMSAVPNPFRDRLALTISLPAGLAGASALLSLTDAAGRVIGAQRLAILSAGASEVAMPDAAKRSSGVYFCGWGPVRPAHPAPESGEGITVAPHLLPNAPWLLPGDVLILAWFESACGGGRGAVLPTFGHEISASGTVGAGGGSAAGPARCFAQSIARRAYRLAFRPQNLRLAPEARR